MQCQWKPITVVELSFHSLSFRCNAVSWHAYQAMPCRQQRRRAIVSNLTACRFRQLSGCFERELKTSQIRLCLDLPDKPQLIPNRISRRDFQLLGSQIRQILTIEKICLISRKVALVSKTGQLIVLSQQPNRGLSLHRPGSQNSRCECATQRV